MKNQSFGKAQRHERGLSTRKQQRRKKRVQRYKVTLAILVRPEIRWACIIEVRTTKAKIRSSKSPGTYPVRMWAGEITLVGNRSSAETTIEHVSAAYIAAQPKYRPSIGEAANRGVFFLFFSFVFCRFGWSRISSKSATLNFFVGFFLLFFISPLVVWFPRLIDR